MDGARIDPVTPFRLEARRQARREKREKEIKLSN